MNIKDIPKDADGRHVIHMTLAKRWTDANGNSRGKLKFHVGDSAETAMGCVGMIYDCSPWFRRTKDLGTLHAYLAEGLRGIAHRVEQDFKRFYGLEVTVIYTHNSGGLFL